MTSLKKLVIEKDVCPLPWMHSEILYSGSGIKPCCKYKENIIAPDNDFLSAWQGETFQKIRHDLANGIPHQNCSPCDVPKDAFSYKKFKMYRYLNIGFLNNIDTDVSSTPRVLHVATTDNTCNLACRMCGPYNSSKLADISSLQKFYPSEKVIPRNSILNFTKESIDSVMQVTFSGGEPMLDKRLPDLIENISQSKQLRIIGFSTNMTVLNYKLLDQLAELDNVKIFFSVSLDGPIHIQEYIRYNCNYSSIVDNLKYIKEKYQNRFLFNINSTVSVYNVGYVKETLDSLVELMNNTGIELNEVMASPVLYPEFLHPGILPSNIKDFYIDKLSKVDTSVYGTIPKSKELVATSIELLNAKKENLYDLFLEFNAEFDKVAGTKFLSLYPEFR